MENDIMDELRAIDEMLTAAQPYGLAIEVIHAYGENRAAGATVRDAAQAALYEWDI